MRGTAAAEPGRRVAVEHQRNPALACACQRPVAGVSGVVVAGDVAGLAAEVLAEGAAEVVDEVVAVEAAEVVDEAAVEADAGVVAEAAAEALAGGVVGAAEPDVAGTAGVVPVSVFPGVDGGVGCGVSPAGLSPPELTALSGTAPGPDGPLAAAGFRVSAGASGETTGSAGGAAGLACEPRARLGGGTCGAAAASASGRKRCNS